MHQRHRYGSAIYVTIACVLVFVGVLAFSLPVHAQEWAVKVTSYNPVFAQTDSDPCTGAAGWDLCALARKGKKMIALSQDLVGRAAWKPFRYHDRVLLASDVPECNGWFIVMDTMAVRWKNRADLFYLNRADNVGCTAVITKRTR